MDASTSTDPTAPGPRLLFLVGPSGVGKSTIAEPLCSELALYHVDIDRHPVKAHGIRDEWQEFRARKNAEPLANALRAIASREGRTGVLVSLPSNKKRLLHPGHVDAARDAGITVIVLWGAEEVCKRARKARDVKSGLQWDETTYDARNRRPFEVYGSPEYDDIRIDVFEEHGRHRPREETLAAIRALIGA
jgi:hypothetical protein